MRIEELLSQDESSRLEFKEQLPSNDKLAALLCAFANTSGGDLVVGVEDVTRKLIGLNEQHVLEIEEKIASIAATSISPMVFPIIKTTRHKGTMLLAVHIDMGFQKPFRVAVGAQRGKIYVRVGSTTRQADRATEEAMGLRSHGLSWDALPDTTCPIKSLSKKLLEEFIEARYERRKITKPKQVNIDWLIKMRLAIPHGGKAYASNGAVLLFTENPQEHGALTGIELARFAGTDTRDFIDKQSSNGPLWKLYDEAHSFMRRHVDTSAVRTATSRWETIAYPEIAFREFMVNALCHRSYETNSGPIRCAIFDDTIQITNPGTFPDGLELSDLGTGISVIRNPIIARVFNEIGLIEGWGTGILVAQQELAKRNLPSARIEQKGFFIQVISPWRWPKTLSNRDTAILSYVASNGNITSEVVAKIIKTTDRAARKNLAQLVSAGHLVKIGTTRGTAYRLK